MKTYSGVISDFALYSIQNRPLLAQHVIEEIMLILPVFQAEDGIRDRSPSRGLGDVYKRQEL